MHASSDKNTQTYPKIKSYVLIVQGTGIKRTSLLFKEKG